MSRTIFFQKMPQLPRGACCRAGIPNSSPAPAARARARAVGSRVFDLQVCILGTYSVCCSSFCVITPNCVNLRAGRGNVVQWTLWGVPRRHEQSQSLRASIQPFSPLLTLRLPWGGAMPELGFSSTSILPWRRIQFDGKSNSGRFSRPSNPFLAFSSCCCRLVCRGGGISHFGRVWDELGTTFGIGCQALVFSAAPRGLALLCLSP